MNQYIQIAYKPSWVPNYWAFWFRLNKKTHREKVPSWLDSNGNWVWRIQNKFKKEGFQPF